MITAQVEQLATCWDEAQAFLPRHWEELALFKDKMPLDIDEAAYRSLEAEGKLLVVTLRKDGALIGYFAGIVGTNPHYRSTPICKMDLMFVAPEHRTGGGGLLLMREVKAELKRRGVRVWWMGSKDHKPIEALFKRFGFEPAETYYVKWID